MSDLEEIRKQLEKDKSKGKNTTDALVEVLEETDDWTLSINKMNDELNLQVYDNHKKYLDLEKAHELVTLHRFQASKNLLLTLSMKTHILGSIQISAILRLLPRSGSIILNTGSQNFELKSSNEFFEIFRAKDLKKLMLKHMGWIG